MMGAGFKGIMLYCLNGCGCDKLAVKMCFGAQDGARFASVGTCHGNPGDEVGHAHVSWRFVKGLCEKGYDGSTECAWNLVVVCRIPGWGTSNGSDTGSWVGGDSK